MNRRCRGWAMLVLAWAAVSVAELRGQERAQPAREGIEFFESKIRPVLVNKCYECHSTKAAKVKGGLYLDSRAALLHGGDNGPAIVPGDPGKSLLIKALHHDEIKMPPKEQLSEQVIADFEQWIRNGAPDPRTTDGAAWKRLTFDDAKDFWSFKPMQKSAPPTVKDSGWARTDVDRFIRAGLEAKDLKPVAEADPVSLLRRVYFDLIGLPPTPEEVDAFVKERTANPQAALEAVVDRLLSSKHYGERWGRHWLDVARYGESNGNADNTPFPHAWRYRNYVIDSFNEDKPYNRFITEQIAGDLLPGAGAEKDRNLIATGFLALTSKPRAQNNPDYRMDLIADQLDVTCRAVMAMTIVCARCHDHKFDPIPTKDYYSLAGIFESSEMMGGPAGQGKMGSPGELAKLSDSSLVMAVLDKRPTDAAICIRGDATKRGDIAPRGFLTAAVTPNTKPVNKAQSGRLELAAWLTQPDHPLTSRVMVNRIWLHLFGQGLSRVPDNFGLHGEPPTHPELLDNLALQFVEDGWSIKKTIRRLVLTHAYQLGSSHDDVNFKTDPDNNLWWRIPARRLEAEAIRDAMLAVSGKLITNPPTGSLASGETIRKKVMTVSTDQPYRSVYLGIVRNALPEALAIFDTADPSLIVGQREVTTVPTQALYLMNSPFVLTQAKAFAERLLSAPGEDEEARVERAFRLAVSRLPTTAERAQVLAYLRELTEGQGSAKAWASFCQTLLASAEFRYLQ
jgi:hypothetical protein